MAGLALGIGIVSYAITVLNPGAKLGTLLFWGLAGVSMLFCLFAGRRSTADCLSQEKREGTLGLLFLTDLKGYDVVLGKLAATSVTGLYALLAVFPVLAVPLMTGGMSQGEVGRMVLVLVNTFFFSISVGIFASAISKEYRTAMAANFLLWLAFVGLPAGIACGISIAKSRWIYPLLYSCPIYSFIQSADTANASRPGDFWCSIVSTALLTLMFTALACLVVPRTWGDKPPRKVSRRALWRSDLNSLVNYGAAEGQIDFRRYALNANAYFWHAARARFKPIHVWLFIIIGAVWWLYCWVKGGNMWLDEATYIFTAIVLNVAFKLWIALEAGQRLGEDRRSGAFELLLPTPLTVSDILRGQWQALRRQFLKPLVVVVVTEIVFFAIIRQAHRASGLLILAMLGVLPFDLLALVWVSMLFALTSKSQVRATMQAVLRVLILPWILFGLLHMCIAVYNWLSFRSWDPSELGETSVWMGFSLLIDAIYGVWAWRAVRREFRQMATQKWKSQSWRILVNQAGTWFGAFVSRVPAKVKIPIGLAFLVALAAVLLAKQRPASFPAPAAVSITQSNAPLQIFRAGARGVFFLLPDGSLLRWGKTWQRQNSLAAMPAQVGTNRDWLKVEADGQNSYGVRTDGRIWNIGLVDESKAGETQLAIDGTNWADIGSSDQYYSFALKKDGTIWGWSPSATIASRTAEQIGTATNWTALCAHNRKYTGLRADGTLWTWGTLISRTYSASWMVTNIHEPTLVCADTNWISLDAQCHARNRAGETWDVTYSLPKPNAPVAVVCDRLPMGTVSYRIEKAPYKMNCELRADGTIWYAPPEADSPYWTASPLSGAATKQFGKRSDWTALWGVSGTAFGLTRDGTFWVWGYDLGREAVVTATTRIQLMQAALNKSGTPFIWDGGGLPPPILAEPRPLMKLSVK